MKQRINIAALLKDCPSGMELDCPMYDNLYFDSVNSDYYGTINCYTLIDGIKTSINFTKYGTFNNHTGAKCVIFPKGKTTWEGFVPPCKFKDGDVIYVKSKSILNTELVGIYKKEDNERIYDYCSVSLSRESFYHHNVYGLIQKNIIDISRLATEEEKQKLFDAIKSNGYEWKEETKTLEKLVEPKFKVGDRIVKRNSITNSLIVSSVSSEYYGLKLSEGIGVLPVSEQDDYELVPNKFDITTLVPFESKVLVRNYDSDYWKPAIFGFTEKDRNDPFYVVGGNFFNECIPYKGNEYLLSTKEDCNNFYKTW